MNALTNKRRMDACSNFCKAKWILAAFALSHYIEEEKKTENESQAGKSTRQIKSPDDIRTCNRFIFIDMIFLPCELPIKLLILLDADDSLLSSETVSLKAESLSGLSVRDSRIEPTPPLVPPLLLPLESEPLPLPLSDEIEIDEFVTPEIVELDRECVRPFRSPFEIPPLPSHDDDIIIAAEPFCK